VSAASNVQLITPASVVPAASGVDLTSPNTSLAASTTVAVSINGTTLDTQYQQLNVAGNVDLTGTTLTVNGSYTPVNGDVFVVVAFSGTRTGTFSNSTVTLNSVTLTVDYSVAGQVRLLAPVASNVFLDGSNNLVFEDLSNTTNDALSISFDGTNYTLTNTAQVLNTTIAGASGSGTNTLTIPASSFSGLGIILNGQGGDDTFTRLNAATGFKSLTINGGDGADTANLSGSTTFANNANLTVNTEVIGVTAAQTTTGTGTISLNAGRNITVLRALTSGGNLTLDADTGAQVAGNFVGVDILANVTAGENLSIEGRGGNDSVGSQNGVLVQSGAVVTSSSATGTVTVSGTGGSGSGSDNNGVRVETNSRIRSGGGNVSVSGQGGGGSGSGVRNLGVYVSSAGQITSSGTGTVTVTGTGGSGSGSNNYGVNVNGTNSRIQSGGGNVSVSGQGGGGSGSGGRNIGVDLDSAGQITSGGTGTVSVSGTGGSGSGSANIGVSVTGATAIIQSGGGNVSVIGQGGGSGSNSYGVSVEAGQITAGGSGTVSVTGTGAGGSGSNNYGVFVSISTSRIQSAGAVTITATGNTTNPAEALRLQSAGSILTTANAPITITADSVNLLTGTSISANFGSVTIQPRTAGTLVDIGGADVLSGSPLTLGLTAAEINQITAGDLTIGRRDIATGTLTVSSAVTFDDETELVANGDVNVNALVNNLSDFVIASNNNVTINTAFAPQTNDSVTLIADADANDTGTFSLAASQTLTTPNLDIIAATADIQGAINSSNRVEILTSQTTRTINLGSEAMNSLALTDAELDLITTPLLIIGDASFNNSIVISGNVTRPSSTDIELNAGSTVTTSGGQINTNGGTLTIDVGNSGAFVPAQAGVDATVSTMSFSTNNDLNIQIDGTTLDTQYQQLNVAGNVDLTGVLLTVNGPYTPVNGNVFVVVAYSGTRTGTFTNSSVTLNGVPLTVDYSVPGQVRLRAPAAGPSNVFLNAANNLVFEDLSNTTNDALSISFDGTNYTLTNTAQVLNTTIAGASGSGTNTLTIPASSFSGPGILLNGQGGDDTFTRLNAATGFKSLTINGGTGFDTATLSGSTTFVNNANLSVNTEVIGVTAAQTTSGTGTITLNAGRNIVVSGPLASGGNLTLDADTGAQVTGNFIGVDISADVTAGGNLLIEGRGGNDSGGSQHGVRVQSGAEVSSSSTTGITTVSGTGGSSTGDDNYGVLVFGSNAMITSTGGNVLVTGRGGGSGAGSGNIGVYVDFGGAITSGGTGTVSVTGTGGLTSGGNSTGVRLGGGNSVITSSGGNVSVAGTGGGSGASIFNYGVDVGNQARITAGGTGTVSVTGIGGSSSGFGNIGVGVSFTNSAITSSGGSISVTGTGTANSPAVELGIGGAIRSGNNANITITADSVNLLTGTSINAGAGSVTIRTRTAGTQINLGGADVLTGTRTLGLSATELAQITAGSLNIGRNDAPNASGNITINSPVTLSSNTQLITPVNVIPAASGVDATGPNVSFSSGADLSIQINGTTVDTQYQQLNVAGNVNLTGVSLALSGSFVTSLGQVFTIVNATSITGTFSGLAENSTLSFNGRLLRVNYTSTTVTLTDIQQSTPTVPILFNIAYLDRNTGNLMVFGTNGNDKISINTSDPSRVSVFINRLVPLTVTFNMTVLPFRNGRVIVHSWAGNDIVSISGPRATEVFAGLGNDYVQGGSGFNVLFGENGNDTLVGGASGDILIGGRGQDSLSGGGGKDILIGGWTTSTPSYASLLAARNAWDLSSDAMSAAINVLVNATRDGRTLAERDTLNGGLDRDLFVGNSTTGVLDVFLGFTSADRKRTPTIV
jgi:hypothetical protein